MPARRPPSVRVKKRNCLGSWKVSRALAVSRWDSAVTSLMPSPPSGPVPLRIILRTSCGSVRTITWAITPPIEKPWRSTRSSPSARMQVTAPLAISWSVRGVEPVDVPTPLLPNVMTWCLAAMPSP